MPNAPLAELDGKPSVAKFHSDASRPAASVQPGVTAPVASSSTGPAGSGIEYTTLAGDARTDT